MSQGLCTMCNKISYGYFRCISWVEHHLRGTIRQPYVPNSIMKTQCHTSWTELFAIGTLHFRSGEYHLWQFYALVWRPLTIRNLINTTTTNHRHHACQPLAPDIFSCGPVLRIKQQNTQTHTCTRCYFSPIDIDGHVLRQRRRWKNQFFPVCFRGCLHPFAARTQPQQQ